VTSRKSTSSNHDTVLAFAYDTAEHARRVERSVAPEVGDTDDERSRTTLDREGPELTITVRASDPVALRAGMNTWLSLVGVAEQVGAARNGSA